jgi:hypothetical protein
MIVWRPDWQSFDAPDKEEDFLRELRLETGDSNPRHPLHGKDCRILGWRGHKDFILHLPVENRYAFVHLTWNKETDPHWPSCQPFDNIDLLNRFLRETARPQSWWQRLLHRFGLRH